MTRATRTRTSRRVGATATVALHAIAALALLSYQPARNALLAAAPIMVDWIVPPKPEPKPEPPTEHPKPRRVVKQTAPPPEPPPILTTAPETPSPIVAPPAPPPSAPAPPAPIAEGPPAVAMPVTAPIFNADYLDNPAPSYPALARRRGEQGRVILRVLVSAEGHAKEVQVRTSSGYEPLDAAARDAVARWKFVPARRGTEPVSAWVLIPISFRLEG